MTYSIIGILASVILLITNQAKTSFLSNVTHEIRTPMNAIIGLNNIAMSDPTASDQVKDYLKKIGASSQHLLGIINILGNSVKFTPKGGRYVFSWKNPQKTIV